MNPTRTLAAIALTSATLALTSGTAAGASTDQCNGNAAIHNLNITITDHTYRATWTPWGGCTETTITIAAHDTAHLTWDPTERQPLIDSLSVEAAAGGLEWSLPAGVDPRCRLQLDLVTGAPLPEVNPTSRYNETAIGGDTNRLIDARYTEAPCTPTTSTTVGTPTSTTVTALPPVTVTWTDELPPATFPPTLPEQPSTTLPGGLDLVGLIPSPTPYTAVPRLPETGAGTRSLVTFGALTTLAGLLALAFTPVRKAMRQHVATHQHERKFDAS